MACTPNAGCSASLPPCCKSHERIITSFAQTGICSCASLRNKAPGWYGILAEDRNVIAPCSECLAWDMVLWLLWHTTLVVYPPRKAKRSETEPARKAEERRVMSLKLSWNKHVMAVISSSFQLMLIAWTCETPVVGVESPAQLRVP